MSAPSRRHVIDFANNVAWNLDQSSQNRVQSPAATSTKVLQTGRASGQPPWRAGPVYPQQRPNALQLL
jgi:hypothetical protein